ncbi:Uncharacterised protein [Chlamydia trachomatis]|nr:Uncharacterised protein [Chlamydia trachomatis]
MCLRRLRGNANLPLNLACSGRGTFYRSQQSCQQDVLFRALAKSALHTQQPAFVLLLEANRFYSTRQQDQKMCAYCVRNRSYEPQQHRSA